MAPERQKPGVEGKNSRISEFFDATRTKASEFVDSLSPKKAYELIRSGVGIGTLLAMPAMGCMMDSDTAVAPHASKDNTTESQNNRFVVSTYNSEGDYQIQGNFDGPISSISIVRTDCIPSSNDCEPPYSSDDLVDLKNNISIDANNMGSFIVDGHIDESPTSPGYIIVVRDGNNEVAVNCKDTPQNQEGCVNGNLFMGF